jgi:hypothetical protein
MILRMTLLLLALLVTPVNAQLILMTPGQYVTSTLVSGYMNVGGQFVLLVGEMARHKIELEGEIGAARRVFWESADGPERVAAAMKFEEALFKKDLYFAAQITLNSIAKTPVMTLAQDLSEARRLDGGIPRYASGAFEKWVFKFVEGSDTKLDRQIAFEKALRYSMTEFEAYHEKRGLAEFLFFNPDGVLRATSPQPQAYMEAWMLGTLCSPTLEAAKFDVKQIQDKVGEVRLAEIVKILRSWSTVESSIEGPWTSPREMLEGVISGKPRGVVRPDLAPHDREFEDLRWELSRPPFDERSGIDSIKTIWDRARTTRDPALFRRAIAERDALLERVDRVDQQRSNRGYQFTERAKEIFRIVQQELRFMDFALRQVEMGLLRSAQLNPDSGPIDQTQKYLVTSGKLGSRVRAR